MTRRKLLKIIFLLLIPCDNYVTNMCHKQVALLGNTIATGAILYVIIKSFEDLSGAHFNPIVSIIFYIFKRD